MSQEELGPDFFELIWPWFSRRYIWLFIAGKRHAPGSCAVAPSQVWHQEEVQRSPMSTGKTVTTKKMAFLKSAGHPPSSAGPGRTRPLRLPGTVLPSPELKPKYIFR